MNLHDLDNSIRKNKQLAEGYKVVPGIDRDRYTERPGLEGPFHTKSGKVVYYDKKEGKYYDPGSDFYISHEDWQAMNEQDVAEATGDEKFDKAMRQTTGEITPDDADEMWPTQEFEPYDLDPSRVPMMEKYKAKLFPLAYQYWTDGDNADELRALGWEPEYGDDYVMVVLYGIGHDGHIQYDKYDFDAEGADTDLDEQSVDEAMGTESAEDQTWSKGPNTYLLHRTGSTYQLLDQKGKSVAEFKVPIRYIEAHLEDKGFRLSKTSALSRQNPDWFKSTAGMAEDLPPPENARKTQIAGTLPTYKKAADMIAKTGVQGKALDFGAGLGHGTGELGTDTHSYEPFPGEKFKPHFVDVTKIPDNTYHKIVNLNVLNVVPNVGDHRIRDSIVKNIGRVLAPGGVAIITTRGKDVLTIKGTPGEEPMSMISKIGTYQKGFSQVELAQYVRSLLGDGFDVSSIKLGPAGVMIKKKSEMSESGDTGGLKSGSMISVTTIKGTKHQGTFERDNGETIVMRTIGRGGNPHTNNTTADETHIVVLKKSHIKSIAAIDQGVAEALRLSNKKRLGTRHDRFKSLRVSEDQVPTEVTHRSDIDHTADIEVLGVDHNAGTFNITYNKKPYTVKTSLFSQEDFDHWQIPDYEVEVINSNGKDLIDMIDWNNAGDVKTDRQIRMIDTIIAYLDTQRTSDIQYMSWKHTDADSAEELYNNITNFYKEDKQKIKQAVLWLSKNIQDADARQAFAAFVQNIEATQNTSKPQKVSEYTMYVAFSYSREGNTEMTPGMKLPRIQLTDPDDEDEFAQKLDALFKKVEFKFDAFEKKIIELGETFGFGTPDLESGLGARSMYWDQTILASEQMQTASITAKTILKFKDAINKYVQSFSSSLTKIGLPGINEYSTWEGVLSDKLTKQQEDYFTTQEGFANIAKGKINVAKMINDNIQRQGVAEATDTNAPVEAHGYTYNNRDQRMMWNKIFKSEEAAYKWANARNATILDVRAVKKPVDETIDAESDSKYKAVAPYKNYKIFVRTQAFNNKFDARTEIGKTELIGVGGSPEEAVTNVKLKIDQMLNAAMPATGGASIDFNVKFVTDILGTSRPFLAKIEKINGEPKLVIAGDYFSDDPDIAKLGFKRSHNRTVQSGEFATQLPMISLTTKSIQGTGLIANGRYEIGNENRDDYDNRIFDLTYNSTAHTASDKVRLKVPALTVGTAR